MATIAGDFLNAYCVYNFGGQWDINREKGYFLENSKDRKYFNIVDYAKQNVFWFYSAYNEYDLLQKEYLDTGINRLCSFAIASKYHGDLLLSPCYKEILTLSVEEIRSLSEKYCRKIISQRAFAKEFLQGKELIKTYANDIVNHHKSLQLIRKYLTCFVKDFSVLK